jgi:Fe-S oxidoreductase
VGLGILQSRPGKKKPIAFIEDMAVPVDRLGEFVRGIDEILADYETSADYYAHASAGCLHIRPLLSLRSDRDVKNMREIAQRAVELTLKLGGAVSAEHGDGLARSEWLEQAYGKQITKAFRDLKRAADPEGLLNPGKILDPKPMDQNLRYGTGYAPKAWQPVFRFSAGESVNDEAGLIDAVEQCNGAGVCRKSDGVMCPSFQASGDEMHSTRGRANLLRAMMTGRFPTQSMAEQSVREALDLCLACKGCKSECPSGVDVARLKYEFFNFYYSSDHRRPFRDFLFGYIDRFAWFGSPFHWVINRFLSSQFVARMGETWLGLSSERPFPKFSEKSLQTIWRAKKNPTSNLSERVIFLSDAFTEYFHPEVGFAALNLLELAGHKIKILPVLGAGRTLISKGFLEPARTHAEKLLRAIQEIDPLGDIPIVGVEPSEIYTLRDEYVDFFPDGCSSYQDAGKIAQRSWMIDEFLLRADGNGVTRINKIFQHPKRNDQEEKRAVLLHGHCYQKAQPPAPDGFPIGVSASQKILEAVGYSVQTIESGCCGMAGAFGYEREHYHFSQSVGELSLFPAIRKARERDARIPVATAGTSCQAQVSDGVGGETKHPIEFVYEAYITRPDMRANNTPPAITLPS